MLFNTSFQCSHTVQYWQVERKHFVKQINPVLKREALPFAPVQTSKPLNVILPKAHRQKQLLETFLRPLYCMCVCVCMCIRSAGTALGAAVLAALAVSDPLAKAPRPCPLAPVCGSCRLCSLLYLRKQQAPACLRWKARCGWGRVTAHAQSSQSEGEVSALCVQA